MHEMSYVRPLVEMVLSQCEQEQARKVTKINISIGEMMDVLDEYIPGLVRFLGKGTPIEDAQVCIKRVPFYVRCDICAEIFKIDTRDEFTWHCPRCGAERRYHVFSGREMRLDSIEVAQQEHATAAC